MADYSLAHIGINAQNEGEARQIATLFCELFGLPLKEGNSSVFAGGIVEAMKAPYLGKNGHIAIGTPNVAEAKQELESRGYRFLADSAKYKADGTLNAIYLADEIGGFAVHLVGKG